MSEYFDTCESIDQLEETIGKIIEERPGLKLLGGPDNQIDAAICAVLRSFNDRLHSIERVMEKIDVA